ncbi:unnamed protein product [Caenorhabditis nigoni]
MLGQACKFFPVLLGITSAACAYFVGVFNQVYLIMIAVEIFKGMKNEDEQLTSEILHARHLEKKLKMRNLYMLLASRDFLMVPLSYALDLSQILESLPFSITTAVTMVWIILIIVLAIFLVLFFFGLFSTFFLSFAIQSTGFIVPLNIMITSVAHCKNMAQPNFTAAVNLGKVQPLAVPIEHVNPN